MPRNKGRYYNQNLSPSLSPVRCSLEHNPPCRLDHTPHQEACFQKAEAHYRLGEYAAAAIMYKAALDFESTNRLYLTSAVLADARAIRIEDRVKIAYLNKDKGDVLYELKKYQESLKYYSDAVEFAPNYSIFHYHKANALYSLNNYQEANHSYSIAITFAPDDPLLYHSKALALAKLPNQREAAIDALDKAAALYSLNVEKSLECYDKIIEIHPQNAYAYCNKGNILYAAGKFPDALKCYDATIRISALGYVKSGSYLRYSQDTDRMQLKYHYIDAYVGKSKILDIVSDQKELEKPSTKFTKILAKFYENKLYQYIQIFCEDNNLANIILGYATGTDKFFKPLDHAQEQITSEIIEIALTGVVD